MASLFTYTLNDGSTHSVMKLPLEDYPNMVELIFKAGCGPRPHLPNDEHERVAAGNLPPNLRILRADGAKLHTFPSPIGPNMEELYFGNCKFLRIPNLAHATGVITMELQDNMIEVIDQPLPPNLVNLNYSGNNKNCRLLSPNAGRITNISTSPRWGAAPAVGMGGTLQFRAAVIGAMGGAVVNDPPVEKNVYKNAHNVHDTGVQKSTKSSIEYLVNYKPELPNNPNIYKEIDNHYLLVKQANCFLPPVMNGDPIGSHLAVYAKNPYSMHGVTFETLVNKVWLRIMDTTDAEKRKELLRRLKEEVLEGNQHCTNGMMVRLTNVFIGFDDNVQMKLNPNQVLQARIPATIAKFRKEMEQEEGKENVSFWLAVYKETCKDLKELEVGMKIEKGPNGEDVDVWDYEQWQPWLESLAEPALEEIWEKNNFASYTKMTRSESTFEAKLNAAIESGGLNNYPFEREWFQDKWYMIDRA